MPSIPLESVGSTGAEWRPTDVSDAYEVVNGSVTIHREHSDCLPSTAQDALATLEGLSQQYEPETHALLTKAAIELGETRNAATEATRRELANLAFARIWKGGTPNQFTTAFLSQAGATRRVLRYIELYEGVVTEGARAHFSAVQQHLKTQERITEHIRSRQAELQ